MNDENILEAVLFTAGEAISLSDLAFCIDKDKQSAQKILHSMKEAYETQQRGIQLIEINETYQMTTNPDYFSRVARLFAGTQKKRLSSTLMETLAIIAYKQPITKPQIEAIRGVTADHAVNKLVDYGLVCEYGRADSPGRPILFGTTNEFLKYYGLKNIDELRIIEEEAKAEEMLSEEEMINDDTLSKEVTASENTQSAETTANENTLSAEAIANENTLRKESTANENIQSTEMTANYDTLSEEATANDDTLSAEATPNQNTQSTEATPNEEIQIKIEEAKQF